MITAQTSAPIVEIELSRLDLKHAELRICDPQLLRRLALSVEATGQQSPVVAVESTVSPSRPVLVDGFLRVLAQRRLGMDTVSALLLPLTEAEGLSWCFRQQQGRRATAVEEGWLVQELHVHQRQPLAAVAAELERSTSWASRRLGLVRNLPEGIQQQVRKGAVSAHAAMRSLVPLARANAEAATALCKVACAEQLTSRQLNRLCAAWRAGDEQQRKQLLADPRLYLRLDEHISDKTAESRPPELVRDFEQLIATARRSHRTLRDWSRRDKAGANEALLVVWPRLCGAFRELTQAVEEQTCARS